MRTKAALLWVLCLGTLAYSSAQNVLGIDFGTEWIKVAVVQRSAGVQIVTNEASKRKSTNALAFGSEQREFGDTAMVKPHKAFTHFRELLGKSYREESLKSYGPQYFPYEIVADEERGAIKIKEGDNYLTPEALVAMMFTYCKSIAQAQTGEKVSDVVVTVPPFYRQFGRQAIMDAATIAGLKVLSLMNDQTAVALKYGIDHNVAALTDPINVMFYDMGSTSTVVSVVQFSSIPDKEAFQKNKTLGQLKVLGVAWDEHHGGSAYTSRVADVLLKKSKKDASGNQRALARMTQTAEKTKIILSANKDAHPSIESFMEDYDYRGTIKRTEFEEASADLFERVTGPVDEVIKLANLTVDAIDRLEVIGGGWRIPKIQDILLSHTKRTQLQKTMNSDECFCFGAALYAASLSTAFRLRKFGVHDITSFPVSIDIDSLGAGSVEESKEDGEEAEEEAKEETSSSSKKNIKLFKIGHKIPAKRLLTFKRDEDLTFTLKYDDTVPADVPEIIAKYNITGVKKAMEKHPNGTKPKINVSFRLTRSGQVDVDKAEAAIEEMVEVEVCETVKIEENETDTEANETAAAEGEAAETAEKAEEGTKEDTKEAKDEDAAEKNDTDAKESKKEKKDKKPKTKKVCSMKDEKKVHRVALQVSAETPVLKPFNASELRATKAVLEEYDAKEKKIRDRASAFNNLESYIYNTREKVESNEEFQSVTTAEFREKFLEDLAKMSSWLDEDGWDATTEVLKDKLFELTKEGDPVFFRIKQLIDRPEAVKKAHEVIRKAEEGVANITKKKDWLNESHTQIVTNKTDILKEWLKNKTEAQEATPLHEDPVFTSEEIYRRFEPIAEALKRLDRIPKPAPPKKPKVFPLAALNPLPEPCHACLSSKSLNSPCLQPNEQSVNHSWPNQTDRSATFQGEKKKDNKTKDEEEVDHGPHPHFLCPPQDLKCC